MELDRKIALKNCYNKKKLKVYIAAQDTKLWSRTVNQNWTHIHLF